MHRKEWDIMSIRGVDNRCAGGLEIGTWRKERVGMNIEYLLYSTMSTDLSLLTPSLACFTGRLARMPHRKWRSTKQQPSRAGSGHQISCCLVSIHFLCNISPPDIFFLSGDAIALSFKQKMENRAQWVTNACAAHSAHCIAFQRLTFDTVLR